MHDAREARAQEAEEQVVDKSPDAFRTISEVAEDLDLPQHVLRFWETRFPQIRPLKRGGGRRYYRPDDVALIMGLKALLYGQGYTIKGVQRILKEQGARSVQAVGRGGALPASVAAPGPDREEAEDAAARVPAQVQGSARTSPASGPTLTATSANAEQILRQALVELHAARDDLARVLGEGQFDGADQALGGEKDG